MARPSYIELKRRIAELQEQLRIMTLKYHRERILNDLCAAVDASDCANENMEATQKRLHDEYPHLVKELTGDPISVKISELNQFKKIIKNIKLSLD